MEISMAELFDLTALGAPDVPQIPVSIASAERRIAGAEVRSVDRAASLLLALGELQGEAGVSELARAIGLHKSTASRLLATLEKRRLVHQDEDSGKFRLGLAVVRLGGQAERSIDLRLVSMSELESLARSVRETTSIHVRRGDDALTLAYSDSSGMGRDRTGRTWPLHATAPGKVLLARQPEREVIRLSRRGLERFTSNTIIRVDLLLDELARVRQRGFATAFGEHETGVNAVAVPVFDQRGAVVAALEIRAAGNRITPTRVPELLDRARFTAATVTAHIGGVVGAI
jgi:IclR family transcriptional regulator, acetate operon repressor